MEATPGAIDEGDAQLGLSKHKGLTNGSGPASKAAAFGRNHRSGAREGPGFLVSPGLTNGSGRVNGGRVNGGRINGGRVNGGRINGGQINGGRVNGGRVNGSRVNGGRVNGTLMTQRIQDRRRRSTRWMAILLALLVFGITLVAPLFISGIFPQPPIVVDGNFGDWAGVPVVPDSPDDARANPDINLVAFTAVQSDRDLFFYIQVSQGGRPFGSGGGPKAAEMFRLFIDRDRSQATGFLGYGLGSELLIEISGYDNGARASTLKVFPAFSQDNTDGSLFESAGFVRAVARGNQIEGSVPLSSLGPRSSALPPFLLVEALDSNGLADLGDAVFSSRPGVLVVSQTRTNATVLPSDRESLLLSAEGHALHQNITLASLVLSVDGSGGGGVLITHANVGARNQTVNRSAGVGETVRVDFTDSGPLVFDPGGPALNITVFGRATGAPGAATLRVSLNGSQFVLTGPPAAGTSGHGSVFPPTAFERAYVTAAPERIVIDGAFADWAPLRPPSTDADDDLLVGMAPTPINATPPPGPTDQSIDIREALSDVNTGPGEVSFYLSVDGSIFPARLPTAPAYPSPSQPASGGNGGGGAPGAQGVDGNLATIYVDSDMNALTGWLGLPGMGIDAIVQVVGSGGAMGRAPRLAATSVSAWDDAAKAFNTSNKPVAVGLSSSKMEAQLASLDLCPSACGRVRYAYAFSNRASAFDLFGPATSGVRGDGQALAFNESAPVSLTAFWGDTNAPALAVSLSSSASNSRVAQLSALLVRFSGVAQGDITRVALYRDGGTRGALDGTDLSAGAVAESTLEPGQVARLVPYNALLLSPGESFYGLVTVDLSGGASKSAFLNSSAADIFGVRATGIVDVRYGAPGNRTPVHVVPAGGGFRGTNDMVINEVNFASGFVEFWDTGGAVTNLTSPSQLGFAVYRTNNQGGNLKVEAIRDLTGSTNAEGFTAYNFSVPLSTATTKYYIGLWCNNCTAGRGATGTNNDTYMDFLQMPRFTLNGSWGKYPDGNVTARNTTNNTRADNNAVPPNDTGTDPSGQNNLIINEVSNIGSWVEVYATHGSTTNLTAPSTIGIEVYSTNSQGNGHTTVSVVVLSGSTSGAGFAAINISVPLSTAQTRYHVALWCSNCTVGTDYKGRLNNTYMDDIEMPRSTANGTWGRYPDADDMFQNTTNNTRALPNTIPEFQDIVLPVGGVAMACVALRRRRTGDGPEEPPAAPAEVRSTPAPSSR